VAGCSCGSVELIITVRHGAVVGASAHDLGPDTCSTYSCPSTQSLESTFMRKRLLLLPFHVCQRSTRHAVWIDEGRETCTVQRGSRSAVPQGHGGLKAACWVSAAASSQLPAAASCWSSGSPWACPGAAMCCSCWLNLWLLLWQCIAVAEQSRVYEFLHRANPIVHALWGNQQQTCLWWAVLGLLCLVFNSLLYPISSGACWPPGGLPSGGEHCKNNKLIELLTKILANTYLLQPGNLDGDLSNGLL